MTEQTDTFPDKSNGGSITVSRLAPIGGLTSRRIIRAVRATLKGREMHSLSIAVVDDATIASIKRRYLNDARATDVLSFDLRDDEDDEAIEGEIVVSAETAHRQAKDLAVDPAEEILRYVIHGTLHLMGYDDHNSASRRRMRLAEDKVLLSFKSTTSSNRQKMEDNRR